MPHLGKWMGLFALGRSLTGGPVIQRAFSEVATVVALTIVSSILIGALLLAGFYGLYVTFTYYGLDAQVAMIVVGALALAVTGILGAIALSHLRRLRRLPQQFLRAEAPLAAEATEIVEAFIDGLLTRPARR